MDDCVEHCDCGELLGYTITFSCAPFERHIVINHDTGEVTETLKTSCGDTLIDFVAVYGPAEELRRR